MPASWSGAMRTTLRGNPRPIPPLPGGRRVPWLCGRWLEGHLQGPQGYPPKAAAADWMPTHRTVAGGHPGVPSSKVAMQRPRCRETRERNRAGHIRLPQATGDLRPRALTFPPHHPGLAPGSTQRLAPASRWMPEQGRHDGGERIPTPVMLNPRQAQHGLVSASTKRSARSLGVDPGMNPG